MKELVLTDPDGDRLDVAPVYGFGEPQLTLGCEQDGEWSGVRLSATDAWTLRDYLTIWLEECNREGLQEATGGPAAAEGPGAGGAGRAQVGDDPGRL